MPRNKELVIERIKEGKCPICGKVTEGKSTLVIDPTFGDVLICEKHMVHGSNTLKEDDIKCESTEKSVGEDATNSK